jgi:hypothetical protein
MCRKNERTHRHHIIPRYMGGTDAAENLVEVTVTQHAMYHFCNHQLWGNEEDKIAWRVLGGQITFDEAKLEAVKLGSKKGGEKIKQKLKDPINLEKYKKNCKKAFHNSPHREKMISKCKRDQAKAVEASRTPDAIEKKKNTFKEIKHQQGEKNSQYGTMWITNGTKEGTYRINKGELIPEGYWKGRICFDIKPKGETATAYGRMWINNGNKNKMIPKQSQIPEGYKKGRLV